MGSAYTPGLTVSPDIVVKRTRRLSIKGETLVKVGDAVNPDTPVGRALLPGALQTIRLAEKLGMEPQDVGPVCKVKAGDTLTVGELIAETKGIFGLGKQKIVSDIAGEIESISDVTGNILVREPSLPIEISAYVQGVVAEVLEGEGAVIETRGAMVQGIFGIGGERSGTIRVAVKDCNEVLDAAHISDSDKDKILIGGSGVTLEAIQRASAVGAKGLVAGGVKDSDLVKFLGYDIGVAITGTEAINITLLVTEGFGYLAMAHRTFELFKQLEGKMASINGATQIRAGVIRPEVIVPESTNFATAHEAGKPLELKAGTPIRVIREPYFGKLGTVTDLPAQLMELESGTTVRVLKAKIEGEGEVLVPRANVEIIAT